MKGDRLSTKPSSAHEMTIGQLLSQVCRMTGHRIRGHMEKIGLHRGQGFALIHLWNEEGVTQRDLSRGMHISPASITTMLQRMERDGWIERRRDEADQRVVRVFATTKAKGLRREAKRVFQEIEDELHAIYTQEECSMLRQLLAKLYEHYAPGDAHPDHMRRFLEEEEQNR